jgi:DNA polymerase elongation subunit (family B)
MSYTFCEIDPNNCTLEELQQEIKRLEQLKNYYHATQLSVKLFINSIYGATASPYFVGYNVNVAEAITLQGQDVIFFSNKIIDEYFFQIWSTDVETHKKLGLSKVTKPLETKTVVYGDTDSVAADSLLNLDDGRIITIEQFYNENIKNGSAGDTIRGHESVNTNNKILNWSEDKKLYYGNVKRIIRHKVSKLKWKLKTKSGKEIIVTNDHSMIVFRNNIKLEVKPSEILKTDKILCIK